MQGLCANGQGEPDHLCDQEVPERQGDQGRKAGVRGLSSAGLTVLPQEIHSGMGLYR